MAVGLEVDLALALARDLGGGVRVACTSTRNLRLPVIYRSSLTEILVLAGVQSSWGGLLRDLFDDRFDLAIGGISMTEARVARRLHDSTFSRAVRRLYGGAKGLVVIVVLGASARCELLASAAR